MIRHGTLYGRKHVVQRQAVGSALRHGSGQHCWLAAQPVTKPQERPDEVIITFIARQPDRNAGSRIVKGANPAIPPALRASVDAKKHGRISPGQADTAFPPASAPAGSRRAFHRTLNASSEIAPLRQTFRYAAGIRAFRHAAHV